MRRLLGRAVVAYVLPRAIAAGKRAWDRRREQQQRASAVGSPGHTR